MIPIVRSHDQSRRWMELGVTASSKPLGKVTAAELLPPLSILPSNQLIFSFFSNNQSVLRQARCEAAAAAAVAAAVVGHRGQG